MYEIKSCGTTIDFCNDHFSASQIYDNCRGPHVLLFKYNGDGNKVIIAERFNNHKVSNSKQLFQA